MRKDQIIYFIGIGGAGMCGIAKLMHDKGYTVAGSDLLSTDVTDKLIQQGIKVNIGHLPNNISAHSIVVISTAIPDNNPELLHAKKLNLPILGRAQALAEVMKDDKGIAIAGAHGKTTTASIMSSIFVTANYHPSFVIGGKVNSSQSHSLLGQGEYFIAEADESDASFLHFKPHIAVINNIDLDHMTTYSHSIEKLQQSFITFANNTASDGYVVINADDTLVRPIQASINRRLLTYGFNEKADYKAIITSQRAGVIQFTVLRPAPHKQLDIELNLPGKHNVLNALAAIVVATEESIDDETLVKSLQTFAGIDRRFNIHPQVNGKSSTYTLIDDYGHHPKEIDAMIDSVRSIWPDKKLIMLFQPHRYTRTLDLFDDFVTSLRQVDQLILLDVYSAGEKAIAGANSCSLAERLNQLGVSVQHFANNCDAEDYLYNLVTEKDILIVQGAGDIAKIAQNLTSR